MIARDRFYSFASVYRAAADSLAGLLERTKSRTGGPARGAACLARLWAILPRLLRQRSVDYH